MRSPCEQVEDFFDGELATAQADRFRDHAASCLQCQRELTALAQLRALEVHYRPELEARHRSQARLPPPPAWRAFPPRWRWAAGGAVAVLAAMLLVWVAWNRVPESTFYPGGAHRLAGGRSSHPLARVYRPPAQGRLGQEQGEHQAPSYVGLGKLERKGDLFGVAAAHLARGTARDAEEALEVLERLKSQEHAGESPDLLSELSFAHLARGDAARHDAEEALRLADQALELESRHGPALWNRALALEKLGLPLLASSVFETVASLGEPGWSDEAREHAARLRTSAEDERKTWLAAIAAGKELVESSAHPSQELLGVSVLRHYFYEAIQSRSSPEEVNRLRPLAREMDGLAGDDALERHVAAIASRNFSVRGPLAAEYKRLAQGNLPLDASSLLRRLRESGQPDLLLGALARLPDAERQAGELESLAREVQGDPWLHTLALNLQARALAKEAPEKAREALEKSLEVCRQARLDYRCTEAAFDLSHLHDRSSELKQADARARLGWDSAIRAREWGRQVQFVLELAQLARHRGDASVARAYYEEGLERAGSDAPEQQAHAHEELALLDVQRLRFDDASDHLDAALATGRPLSLHGALALADIARVKPKPRRDAAAMEAFRTSLKLDEEPPTPDPRTLAEQALAEHALGRWEIERDRGRGETPLRNAIRHASASDLATRDHLARRTLAYSYTSLILDAGKRGDAEGALRLFEEEAGGALPATCSLFVTADGERFLAVVRGPKEGAPVAVYDAGLRKPLPEKLWNFLPRDIPDQLSHCPRVDVLARAPLQGRPGLLPGTLAWSYRATLPPSAPAPSAPRRHLVVQDVSLSPARRQTVKPLAHWQVPEAPGEPVEGLGGQEATPPMVLRRMEEATDITFVVHALVQPESDEAYLVLAPEAGGADGAGKADVLRASVVGKIRLRAHPVVVLASSRGGHPASVLHEPRSLPAAFLRAGARAVLAAGQEVPERDGPEFFGAVRARIQAGVAPAEALRAVRAEWQTSGRAAPWLDEVVLFE